ncbi:MAG: hypothetical protein ACR2J8_07485, partial [Thermomicrobiales bacterium]
TYFQHSPRGTYCLLPNGKNCAAGVECASGSCAKTCQAEPCDVCANGCPHTTVQAAIDAASAGSTIKIDAGIYAEDLKVTNMDLTLTNCNGSAVTLKNVADGSRTLMLGDLSDVAPHKMVTIRNLTITGSSTPIASDPEPVVPTVGTGGIEAYTNLIIEGTTRVTGCNWLDNGGGIYMGPVDEALTLTVRDQAEVSDNYADAEGGGIYLDSYIHAKLILEDDARIVGNYATGAGGGFKTKHQVLAEMSGNAEVSYNRASYGGAGYIYCSTDALCLKMTGQSRMVFNTAKNYGGGAIWIYDNTDTYPNTIEMYDDTLIADNQSLRADTYGAGIYAEDSTTRLLMTGNARITRNTVVTTTTVTDGGGVYQMTLDIRDQAAIISNTPGNCQTVTFEPGSKQCGVA